MEKKLINTAIKNRNCCISSILGFAFGLKQKKHSGAWSPWSISREPWSPVYFGLEPGSPAILSPEPRSPEPLWDPDIINSYIILVAILTTCLFRQNRFNIYFNYHSDADECLNNSHNCSENANCTNTEGSFNCSCKPGYIGNGHNCSGWFLEFLSRFPLVLRLLV